MAKYRVVRPWHGVSVGQVVDLDVIHPSISPNVALVIEGGPEAGEADGALARAKAEIEALRQQAEVDLAQRVEDARERAREEASGIINSAREEANRVISDAQAEAERIKAEAVKQAGELIPATPDATAVKRGRPPKADSSSE